MYVTIEEALFFCRSSFSDYFRLWKHCVLLSTEQRSYNTFGARLFKVTKAHSPSPLASLAPGYSAHTFSSLLMHCIAFANLIQIWISTFLLHFIDCCTVTSMKHEVHSNPSKLCCSVLITQKFLCILTSIFALHKVLQFIFRFVLFEFIVVQIRAEWLAVQCFPSITSSSSRLVLLCSSCLIFKLSLTDEAVFRLSLLQHVSSKSVMASKPFRLSLVLNPVSKRLALPVLIF